MTDYAAMSNAEMDRKLAEWAEPEPKDIDSSDTFWGVHYGISGVCRVPARFTTNHNAFALLWARLTEEQQYAVCDIALAKRHKLEGTHPKWTPYRAQFRRVMSATPRQKCEWVLRALEGQ